MDKAKRIRAIADKYNEIGVARHKLYKNAFSRINKSIKEGYYLEAITLVESIISDRLESRLTFLLKENFAFKTLGQLIDEIKKVETDEAFKQLIVVEVNNWREKRNSALHEIAKIEEGRKAIWEERIKVIEPTAKEGLIILRKVMKFW